MSWLRKHWARLSTYSGSRRLSWFSLILLFGLDLYVLGLTFRGMEEAAQTIAYPRSGIASECAAMTEAFLKQDPTARAASLRRYVLAREDITAGWSADTGTPLPVCVQVLEKLRNLAGDAPLAGQYRAIEARADRIAKLRADMAELKASYDSALLEKIAGQSRDDSILPAEATKIKGALAAKGAELSDLESKQAAAQHALEDHATIRDYTAMVESLPIAAEFGRARQDYERLAFWYPVKVLAAQVSFLLPLLVGAIWWNRRALDRRNDVQTLITSHLILVCAVPVFYRGLEFVYDLLPHRLLAGLIETLEQLNLGFLWSYVAIAGGIGVGLVLIYVAQKTFFSPMRQRSNRLRRNLCRQCGEKLSAADQAWCEFCGTGQLGLCAACGKPNRLLAYRCQHCGAELGGAS